MNIWIGRVAAALASFIVVGILNLLGIPLGEEETAGIVEWLTEGLTMIGGLVMLSLYGVFHKLIDKRVNPSDNAR